MRKALFFCFLLAGVFAIGNIALAQTDATPPVISSVRVENIYGSGAQVKWSTDEPSDSEVMFGTVPGSYSRTSTWRCDNSGNVTDHCVNLTELSYSTVYYYKVKSRDASGNLAVSSEYQFTSGTSMGEGGSGSGSTSTSGSVPSAPSSLTAAVASNGTDMVLMWQDNSNNESEFRIYWRAQGGSWSYLTSAGSNYTSFTYYSHPTGTYDYHLTACNSYGCSVESNTATVTKSAAAATTSDATAPVISNVRAENITTSGAQIKWTTDDLADSRVAYGTAYNNYTSGATGDCFSGNTLITEHCVNLYGLNSGTTYYYKVESRNSAGLDSQLGGFQFLTLGASATSSTSTSSSTDITPPTVVAFGVGSDPDGKLRPGASFSETIDQATLIDSNVYVQIYSTGAKVSGTIGKYTTGVDFLFSAQAGVEYQLIVKDVKDLSGNKMSAVYYSPRFTTGSTTSYYTTSTATTSYAYATTSTYQYSYQTSLVADSTIKGLVTDAGGVIISSANIHIYKEDYSLSYGAISGSDGSFTVNVVSGTYLIDIYPPSGRTDLIRPAPTKLTISSNETKTVTLQFGKAVKKIAGAVLFSNNQPVTDAEVGAYNEDSRQWVSALVNTNGNYTLTVGPGKWQVGLRPQNPLTAKWHWSGPFQEVVFGSDTAVESKTVNFVIIVSDSTVVARTLDQDLRPISGASVVLSTYSQTQTQTYLAVPPEYRSTDTLGFANFPVVVGRYYLRAYLASDKGYINPEEQVIDISAGQTKEVTLIFRKVSAVPTVVVSGLAKLDAGQPTDAFVWAWSEKGFSAQIRADINGRFSFVVPVFDRVRLGAGKELNGFAYESGMQTIEVKDAPLTIELVLTKVSATPLSQPVTTTQSATQQVVAQVQDGASVVVPSGAAVSSGTFTVQVDPTNEAPSLGGAAVVSTVYDITIKDQAGAFVTQLQNDIEVRIPYSEAELLAQGVSEQAVVPSFFDEKTGTWVKVDNYTIDPDQNIVIARVSHLTRFALVAAADITPPNAPTQTNAVALGSGKIQLTWVNPVFDFRHAKIYRSTTAGSLGQIIAAEVFENRYVDSSGIIDKQIYYYTVRAVDPAGNESGNTAQTSIIAKGSSIGQPLTLPPGQATKAAILRTLKQGLRGEDVKVLQQFLLDQGVYPQGLITGYFGNLTRQAVIRFQEKYNSEILAPLKLSKGTGIVGPATRKKVNELLQK